MKTNETLHLSKRITLRLPKAQGSSERPLLDFLEPVPLKHGALCLPDYPFRSVRDGPITAVY